MPGIDFGNVIELADKKEYQIDAKTVLKTMKGNHPVEGGVVLYRFESEGKAVVYATDNEFDYLNGGIPNPQAAELKEAYVAFIKEADVLVADAQYTKEHYLEKKPNNVQGFGHSYVDQIVDLAEKGKVKKAVLTHHHSYGDAKLAEIEKYAQEYAKSQGYEVEVVLAKEGMVIEI
jgi:ribonuclease BN (tRNA processing enzyme)